MKKQRIGIYGGSFSPPHAGHVKLAEAFLASFRLDRLLVIPSGNPPHKRIDGGADGKSRVDMCRAAFLPLSDKIEVSELEAFRTDPCYTVDTLRHYSSEGELYMLCGSDMFLTLESWREPEEIFRLSTVVGGARIDDSDTATAMNEAADRYRRRFGAVCHVMEFEPIELSSTSIRHELETGKKPEGICDGVFEIIKSRGLYGSNR